MTSIPPDRVPGSRGVFDLDEHSGDVKLRARGPTLENIFVNAAKGMMAFMFGDEILNARPERWEAIRIEAADREALLVDWLAELLYRTTSQYHAYAEFRLRKLSEHGLVAEAGIATAEARDDIKAVTHHDLAIRRVDGGWEAVVVLDI